MPNSEKNHHKLKQFKESNSIVVYKVVDKENFGLKKSLLNFVFVFLILVIVIGWEVPTFSKEIPNNGFTQSFIKNLNLKIKTSGFSKVKKAETNFYRKVVKNQDIETFDEETVEETTIVKVPHPQATITITSEVLLPEKLEKPLKIMVMGDSMIQEDLGVFLENQLSLLGFNTKRVAKYSTGLTNRKYFDWESYAQKQLLEFQPEVAIAMFGANDGQDIVGAGGRVFKYGSAGWNESYAQNVRSFLTVNSKLVKKFYFVGQPIPGNSDFKEKFIRMNGIYESVTSEFSNVVFVKTWDRFVVNGAYSPIVADKNGFRSRVKYDDGVHLTTNGAKVLFEVLQEVMQKDIVF